MWYVYFIELRAGFPTPHVNRLITTAADCPAKEWRH
jgi:hypothetical protein